MTYDPRDTDPLHVEEYDWDGWLEDYKRKPGVPRAVLVWGFGMVLVIAAVLVIAGWVR